MKECNVLNFKESIKGNSRYNVRIIYVKKNGEFFSDQDYSTFCKNEAIIQYENKNDIIGKINNYKNMKNAMIK